MSSTAPNVPSPGSASEIIVNPETGKAEITCPLCRTVTELDTWEIGGGIYCHKCNMMLRKPPPPSARKLEEIKEKRPLLAGVGMEWRLAVLGALLLVVAGYAQYYAYQLTIFYDIFYLIALLTGLSLLRFKDKRFAIVLIALSLALPTGITAVKLAGGVRLKSYSADSLPAKLSSGNVWLEKQMHYWFFELPAEQQNAPAPETTAAPENAAETPQPQP